MNRRRFVQRSADVVVSARSTLERRLRETARRGSEGREKVVDREVPTKVSIRTTVVEELPLTKMLKRVHSLRIRSSGTKDRNGTPQKKKGGRENIYMCSLWKGRVVMRV